MPIGKWKYCILGGVWPNPITDKQIYCPKIIPTKEHSCTNSRLTCPPIADINSFMLVSCPYSPCLSCPRLSYPVPAHDAL